MSDIGTIDEQDRDWEMGYDELIARAGKKALSDERLAELRARIFPVLIDEKTGALEGVSTARVHPRGEAFAFAPHAPRFDPGPLVEIGRIETYHPCAFPLFFKPTEAQFLAQIPPAYLDRIVAYGAWDANEIAMVAGALGHRVTIRLFARR